MSLPGTHPMSAMRDPNHPFHTGEPFSEELLAAEREYARLLLLENRIGNRIEEPLAGLLLAFCLCSFSGALVGLAVGLLIGWQL